MSGSNALQITDPNADNPLAQAPSWADAAQSVAGTVSSGVDALGQWLAAQRAKNTGGGGGGVGMPSLDELLAYRQPQPRPPVWPMSNPVGTDTTQSMQSATPINPLMGFRSDGSPITGTDLAAVRQGMAWVKQAAPTMVLGMMGTTAPGIRAFHGSPYDFARFDTSKIGTGEGAQAYGHGLYFAEGEGTARSYRDQLAPQNIPNPEFLAAQHEYNAKYDAVGRATSGTDEEFNAAIAARDAARERLKGLPAVVPNPAAGGHMYEVNIGADPEKFLHWDKPLSEQSPQVQDALAKVAPEIAGGENIPGSLAYYRLAGKLTGNKSISSPEAAEALRDAGIPGIRYLDQGSRGAGEGTHNYVVFDANTIDILRKYGLAGLGIGLSGAAATNGSQQQPPMAQ